MRAAALSSNRSTLEDPATSSQPVAIICQNVQTVSYFFHVLQELPMLSRLALFSTPQCECFYPCPSNWSAIFFHRSLFDTTSLLIIFQQVSKCGSILTPVGELRWSATRFQGQVAFWNCNMDMNLSRVSFGLVVVAVVLLVASCAAWWGFPFS